MPDDDSRFSQNEEGSNTNAITSGGNVISVKESRKNAADTGPHEVGHTLGLKHYNSGVMTAGSSDAQRSSTINSGNVNDIIKNSFKNKRTKAGKGSLTETGTSPANFKKGTIQQIPE